MPLSVEPRPTRAVQAKAESKSITTRDGGHLLLFIPSHTHLHIHLHIRAPHCYYIVTCTLITYIWPHFPYPPISSRRSHRLWPVRCDLAFAVGLIPNYEPCRIAAGRHPPLQLHPDNLGLPSVRSALSPRRVSSHTPRSVFTRTCPNRCQPLSQRR